MSAFAMPKMLSSNRKFGLVLVGGMVLVQAGVLWSGGRPHPWVMEIAGVIVVIALMRPQWLSPLRTVMGVLGKALQRLLQPVGLALLFYGVFTPLGLAMRLVGRDLMKRRLESQALSYWIRRDPRSLSAESFREQF